MRNNFRGLLFVFLSLVLMMMACNLGASAPTEVVNEPPTEALSVATDVPVTAEVQHVMVPGELPKKQSGLAGDQDSSTTADEKRAPAGDRFTYGRYERPFNANEMDVYFSNIDILVSEVYQDDVWIYGTLTLKDTGSGCSLDGKYGFELDTNIDGGGDLLVLVTKPTSTDWSTDGVEVWFDENDDVGGTKKVFSDESSSVGNGYESQLFGAGAGNDPDLAWARIAPTDPCVVQMAVKQAGLSGPRYMIGMWAGNDLLNPALFDHNDGFTHDQAGSSLIEFEYFYPVKEVYELDNVCRMAVGFDPTGSEPGICPVPPSGGGDEPPPPPGNSCPPPSILFCGRNGCYCLEPAG